MAALLLTSCLPATLIWTATYNFPGGRWGHEEKVTFRPDTIYMEKTGPGKRETRGVISLRYNGSASLETLPLVIETESPEEGAYRSDTIGIRLLRGDRRMADKATLGVFETVDTVILNPHPAPGWTMTLYPANREGIEGVYSLTLEIINIQ